MNEMKKSPFLNDETFFKATAIEENGHLVRLGDVLLKSKKIWVPPSGKRKGYYRMDPRTKHEGKKGETNKKSNIYKKEKEFIEQAIKDVAEDNSWDYRFDDNEFQNWNTDETISKNEFIKKYEDEITGRTEVLMGEWADKNEPKKEENGKEGKNEGNNPRNIRQKVLEHLEKKGFKTNVDSNYFHSKNDNKVIASFTPGSEFIRQDGSIKDEKLRQGTIAIKRPGKGEENDIIYVSDIADDKGK